MSLSRTTEDRSDGTVISDTTAPKHRPRHPRARDDQPHASQYMEVEGYRVIQPQEN